jgi:hypothetical protein
MTSDQLQSMIASEARDSIAYLGGNSRIASERARALQYYFAEPVGNLAIDDENRSKVISHDVSETVEWILPSLLRIFTSGDEVVSFQPQGPEDEKAAKEATEYCNWIFTRDNPGFLILYTNMKDALLQKNGIGKVWWEVKETNETRTVYGIDDDTYSLLLSDPNVEIVAHSEIAPEIGAPPAADSGPVMATVPSPVAPGPLPPQQSGMPPQAPMQPPGAYTHDVTYKMNTKKGKVCIEAVPPEEFLMARDGKEITTTAFCGHMVSKSISDLIAEGYDEDQLMDMPSDDVEFWGEEAEVRRDTDEANSFPDNRKGVLRKVSVLEAYPLVDFDGDGIAERRQVICGGPGFEILRKNGDDANILWEGPPPFYSITPIIQPHKFFGQSVAEVVMDIQDIKTAILRGTLDNLYLTNMPGSIVSDQVNMDDYMDRRPGRAVRLLNGAKPGDGHVQAEEVPFVAGASYNMLEYLDTERAERTGVTKYTQGLDANSLNKTATGINQITAASQQRLELIARIFAETGIKDLFRLILHCVCKYQDKARMIRLRGEWVTIDPNEWDTEFDMTISVGLGTGNKDQMLGHLMQLWGIQSQIVSVQQGINGPLVGGENLYNTLSKLVENAGLKSPELYFMDPKLTPQQPPQPKPDPEMMKIQQQGQLAVAQLEQQKQVDAQKLQLEQAKLFTETHLKQQQQETDAAIKMHQINSSNEIAKKPTANVNIDAQNSLGPVAETMTQLAANQQQFMEQQSAAMTQALQAIGQAAQVMAQAAATMASPKRVVRGPDGKVAGVEPVSVQ